MVGRLPALLTGRNLIGGALYNITSFLLYWPAVPGGGRGGIRVHRPAGQHVAEESRMRGLELLLSWKECPAQLERLVRIGPLHDQRFPRGGETAGGVVL